MLLIQPQTSGTTSESRQAWANWLATVCQDVPDEMFRDFQHETFTVCMRYLHPQYQEQTTWQPAPRNDPVYEG